MPDKNKKNNSGNKSVMWLVSILIAISLWILINYTEDPTIDVNLSNIKIEYKGLKELEKKGLAVNPSDKEPTAAFSMRGSRTDLMHFLSRGRAYVDVSGLDEADTYSLDIQIDIPVSGVEITKQKVKTLDVEIEPLVTKNVPIEVKQIDKNKDYLISSEPVDEYVTLTAARSVINNISRVAVYVSVQEMKEDNTQEYSYTIVGLDNTETESDGVVMSDKKRITIHNEIYKPATLGFNVEIPDSVASMYSVDVTLSGSVSVGIRDGAPEKLTALFPENAIKETGTNDYTVTIQDDEGVYIEDANREQKVRAVVAKKELSYIKTPIKLINIPDGYTAHAGSSALDTYINCVPTKLTSAAALTAYADLEGLGAGEHTVELTFNTVEDVTVVGTYSVDVEIEKKEENGE